MTHYAGLNVSQKETTIWVVDEQGRRLWRGHGPNGSRGSDPAPAPAWVRSPRRS